MFFFFDIRQIDIKKGIVRKRFFKHIPGDFQWNSKLPYQSGNSFSPTIETANDGIPIIAPSIAAETVPE